MKYRTKTKPNRQLAGTSAYYLSIFILGLFASANGPALLSLAENTATTLDRISLIFVFASLGYLLGSLLGGEGYDRLPGHRLMAFTLLTLCLGSIIVPLSQQLWLLLLAQFSLGLAQGANDVGCNTLLLWTHRENAGPFVNGLHFSFGLGAFVSPLVLAGTVALTGTPLWAFWLFSLLCLPMAIWFWTLPDIPKQNTSSTGKHHSIPIIPVLVMVLSFAFYVGGEIGFGSWVYTYATTLGLGTSLTAAYLTSAFWGTFTFGRLLGVWIATRARPNTILYVDLLGCSLSLGLILLRSESALALWVGSVGLGLFMASIFPTILLLAGERLRVTGKMTGWFLVGGGLGGMLLPWGVGQVFVRVGPTTMPLLVLGTITANLLTIILFSAISTRRTNS